jgi:Zn-dependent hydrolases, including glyoxylases
MKKAENIRYYPVKRSEFTDWEAVFKNPASIKIETVKTGIIISKISGILNLENVDAAKIPDGTAVIPVLAYLIRHGNYGDYLIDTGFDSSFSREAGGNYRGILKRIFFNHRYIQETSSEGIEQQLKEKSINLSGVFLTHFHEHLSGSVSLPDEIPFAYGDGEAETNFFPFVYSRFLNGKTNLLKIDFSAGQSMPVLGNCVDLFGDGSLWAVSTPGHTKGHTSFIVNGKEIQAFVAGDACISKKGFELGVETGTYTSNLQEGRKSFLKIKAFAEQYPGLTMLFGHETDEFKIAYQ